MEKRGCNSFAEVYGTYVDETSFVCDLTKRSELMGSGVLSYAHNKDFIKEVRNKRPECLIHKKMFLRSDKNNVDFLINFISNKILITCRDMVEEYSDLEVYCFVDLLQCESRLECSIRDHYNTRVKTNVYFVISEKKDKKYAL